MATITKTLSAKQDNTGFSELLMRVTFGAHGAIRIKTGIFVPVNRWNNKKKEISTAKAIGNAEHAFLSGLTEKINKTTDLINAVFRVYLQEQVTKELISAVIDKCADLQASTLTKEQIEEQIHTQEQEEQKNIYQLAEEYLQEKQFSYDHTKGFKVLVRDIARYENYIRATENEDFVMDINTIDKDTIEDFYNYLMNEYQLAVEQPKLFKTLLANYPLEISKKHNSPKLVERGDNTISKLRKKFKAFYKWLNETGYTTNNPFEGIKIGTEKYSKPFLLTIEERDLIADYDLSDYPTLEVQRDIFIFQCMIGCRVGDLMRLTEKENINNDVLVYVPHKTKDEKDAVKATIPLTTKAQELIEEYRGSDAQGRLFPFISAQKYNNAIKQIAQICGIDRPVAVRNSHNGETEYYPLYKVISTHTARKTFVGNTYNQVKDPSIVSAMSGHVEGSRAFARYREIGLDTLRETIDKIDTAKQTDEEQDKADLLNQLASLTTEQLKALLGK